MLARLRTLPVVGTAIAIVEEAIEDGATDSAASIAYYAFFSLFPLLLGLIAIAGFALEAVDIRLRIDQFLVRSLPGSADYVREILDSVVRVRTPAGILGLVALLWSASAAFGAVSRAINQAWRSDTDSPFYLSKLQYIGLCVVASLLFILSAVLTGGVELVVGLNLDVPRPFDIASWLARAAGGLVSFVFLFSMFALLYKVLPRRETQWREVWPGALLAASLLEVGKLAFVRYLNGLADFEAVYGSLSSVIVLLLWLYVSAWILILGAELIYLRGAPRELRPVDPVARDRAPTP